jgi:hypothetical protein
MPLAGISPRWRIRPGRTASRKHTDAAGRVVAVGDRPSRGVFEAAETTKGIIGIGDGERHHARHLRLG